MKIKLCNLSDDDGLHKLEYAMAWLTQNIPNPPTKFPQKWNVINDYNEATRELTVYIDFLYKLDTMWFLDSVT